MERGGSVYIMTNERHSVFYVGVSSNLFARISDHKNVTYPGSFTARYNVFKLVYFEDLRSIEEAISREKQMKKYRREKKIALIESVNPDWNELFDELE